MKYIVMFLIVSTGVVYSSDASSDVVHTSCPNEVGNRSDSPPRVVHTPRPDEVKDQWELDKEYQHAVISRKAKKGMNFLKVIEEHGNVIIRRQVFDKLKSMAQHEPDIQVHGVVDEAIIPHDNCNTIVIGVRQSDNDPAVFVNREFFLNKHDPSQECIIITHASKFPEFSTYPKFNSWPPQN